MADEKELAKQEGQHISRLVLLLARLEEHATIQALDGNTQAAQDLKADANALEWALLQLDDRE